MSRLLPPWAALALLLIAAPAAHAQLTVDQNDAGCDDSVGTPYCTIQAAVDDAPIGGTVSVAPGTYVENVLVEMNLTLESTGGRAVTTIEGVPSAGALGTVQVTNNTTAFTLGGTGMGFTVVGIDNGAPGIENAAVYFQGGHSGATIRDNEVRANGDHGLLTEFGATITGFTIDNNTFSGQTFMGATPGGCGFGSQFATPNVPRQLVTMGGGTGGGSTSAITFTDNQVTGTAGGASAEAGCTASGQGNTLVTIDANGGTIMGNAFAGTTARFATSLRARGPATTINSNTFDSSGLLNPPANGHVFIQTTGETLSTVAAANTFDKGVYVDGTVGMIGLSVKSFVEAVGGPIPAGSTVNVLAGTYVEAGQINVKADLDLVGADRATTIIQPGMDTGTSGDARGFFLVDNGVPFDLSEVTIDGTGRKVYQAIRHKGEGNVMNVDFREIKFNESGPTYNGVAIAAFGTGDVHVTNSTFAEIGRIGVLYFGTGIAGSTFSDNTYTGKGVGDWLDYALDISAGATVMVEGNTISGNRGVASSDGSTSAGILVTTFFAGGTTATIEDNTLTDNTTGVAVGFDASDASSVTIEQNNITGNDNGVTSTAATVAGTCNWWGDASGPSGEGPGTGDPVGENVTFDPWLYSPAPSLCAPTPVACTTASPLYISSFANGSPGAVTVTNSSSDTAVDLPGCTLAVFDGFSELVTDTEVALTPLIPTLSYAYTPDVPAGPGAVIVSTASLSVDDGVSDAAGTVVAAVVFDENGDVFGECGDGPMGAQGDPGLSSCDSPAGAASISAALAALFGGAVAGEDGGAVDLTVAVWPNPSDRAARVGFGLAEAGDARVSVVDALGREVAVLADGPRAAGRHDVALGAAALPAGVYVVRVATGGAVRTARLTVAR